MTRYKKSGVKGVMQQHRVDDWRQRTDVCYMKLDILKGFYYTSWNALNS